jgi:hypothetical protein
MSIDVMKPTNKLRFVERTTIRPYELAVNIFEPTTIRVLQQWWEDNSHDIHWTNGAPGEWRDVTLEEEK